MRSRSFRNRSRSGARRRVSKISNRLKLLAQAVESSRDIISITDLSDRFTFVNQAFLAAYGYSSEKVLGQHVSLVDSPRNPPEVRRAIFEETRHGGFQGELLNRRKSGVDFPVFLSTSQVLDAAGQVIGLVGVARDITERREAEALQSALYRITEKAGVTRDLEEFYAFLHGVIGELMFARNFFVATYDEAVGLLSFPCFVDEFDPRPAPKSLGKGLTEYVLRTGEPLLCTEELHKAMIQRGDVEMIGTPSPYWLGVPLKAEGGTFGVLVVQSYSEAVPYGEKEKGILTFVARHIATALGRTRAAAALRDSEERFRTLFNSTFEGIAVHEGGRILEANQVFADLVGRSLHEIVGCSILDLIAPASREAIAQRLRVVSDEPYELELKRYDGQRRSLKIQSKALGYGDHPARIVAVRDVTDAKRLEDQLRQGQKMEAVGRLAGGVAHDFNNLLTTLLGYSELVLARLTDKELRSYVEEIRAAGLRAASLTQQLLAFSRKQILAPRAMDLNTAVLGLEMMLRPLIGEDITLDTSLAPGLLMIKADPGQIEQVIVNLAVNARDAMPEGGTLRITTGRGDRAQVVLTVADTGVGMDAETRSHLFEPFFTTKEPGKGTGLGLATVYGIVQQVGGQVQVQSEPGRGSSFRIILVGAEASAGQAAPVVPESPAPDRPSGRRRGTVLLVEDEESVRRLVRRFLEAGGHTVLEAPGGEQALAIVAAHARPIDLMVCDLVMPGLSGRQVAEQLAVTRPEMKILFVSGYTDDTAIRREVFESGVAFLQKPFTMATLAERVDRLLGEPSPG